MVNTMFKLLGQVLKTGFECIYLKFRIIIENYGILEAYIFSDNHILLF